jgi:hypothetical protein
MAKAADPRLTLVGVGAVHPLVTVGEEEAEEAEILAKALVEMADTDQETSALLAPPEEMEPLAVGLAGAEADSVLEEAQALVSMVERVEMVS